MHNVMSHFFTFFQNCFFSKTNNAKIIPLIIFLCFHIIIISITLKNNFTKERRMYEHVWTYFIHNYTCL